MGTGESGNRVNRRAGVTEKVTANLQLNIQEKILTIFTINISAFRTTSNPKQKEKESSTTDRCPCKAHLETLFQQET